MKNQSDVIIIGAGAIGVCTAYYLNRAGLAVTVLEKNDVCSGCSYGNAGLVVPSHFIPLAAPGVVAKGLKWMFNPESPFYIKPFPDFRLLTWLWRFARASNHKRMQKSMPLLRDLSFASRDLYQELAEADHAGFELYTKGLLVLYKSGKGAEECRQMIRMAETLGIEAEGVDEARIAQLDANIRTPAKAVYFSQDAHVNPHQFVQFLREHVQSRGVEIHTNTEVTGFETTGEMITKVRTSKGEFTAKDLVLASGSWSSSLLNSLGTKFPAQPGKGYSITFNGIQNIPHIPVLCTEAKVAVTPMGDRLRYGGTMELSGLDLSINQRRVNAILTAVPEYLPAMASNTLDGAEIWSGLRPCSPDGLPFIGRFDKWPNLIAATGHAMIGISLAPITGKLVSEIVLNRQPSIDIGALRVERF